MRSVTSAPSGDQVVPVMQSRNSRASRTSIKMGKSFRRSAPRRTTLQVYPVTNAQSIGSRTSRNSIRMGKGLRRSPPKRTPFQVNPAANAPFYVRRQRLLISYLALACLVFVVSTSLPLFFLSRSQVQSGTSFFEEKPRPLLPPMLPSSVLPPAVPMPSMLLPPVLPPVMPMPSMLPPPVLPSVVPMPSALKTVSLSLSIHANDAAHSESRWAYHMTGRSTDICELTLSDTSDAVFFPLSIDTCTEQYPRLTSLSSHMEYMFDNEPSSCYNGHSVDFARCTKSFWLNQLHLTATLPNKKNTMRMTLVQGRHFATKLQISVNNVILAPHPFGPHVNHAYMCNLDKRPRQCNRAEVDKFISRTSAVSYRLVKTYTGAWNVRSITAASSPRCSLFDLRILRATCKHSLVDSYDYSGIESSIGPFDLGVAWRYDDPRYWEGFCSKSDTEDVYVLWKDPYDTEITDDIVIGLQTPAREVHIRIQPESRRRILRVESIQEENVFDVVVDPGVDRVCFNASSAPQFTISCCDPD